MQKLHSLLMIQAQAGMHQQNSHGLPEAANAASQSYFGKNAVYLGEGGSIPFMGMLGKKFPQAQFVITGFLGQPLMHMGQMNFYTFQRGKN